MQKTLSNTFAELTLLEKQWRFSNGAIELKSISPSLCYLKSGRKVFVSLHTANIEPVDGAPDGLAAHGAGRGFLSCGVLDNGLAFTIQYFLPDAHELLLWRIHLENQGSAALFIHSIGMLNLHQNVPLKQPAFFSNGWQSWSYAGTYNQGERYHRTRLGLLSAPMLFNPGTPQPRQPGWIASDMFGVLGDQKSRQGALAGFISQRNQFGSLQANLTPDANLLMWANGDDARLDPGEGINTDWACLQFITLDSPDPLGAYLDAVAREHGLVNGQRPADERIPPPQSGWCSWYYYFQKISQGDIQANLEMARRLRPGLPLELIQIDDGFESQIGDWFTFSPGFAQGVAPLAAQIKKDGFLPGLWLAPFILHPKAKIAAQHPDWLLRNQRGRPVTGGFVWNTLTQALDITVPEALEYASESVRTAAQSWGFPFLKLDFLYAAALGGRYHDPRLTRAQVMRKGLEALRSAAGPETVLLGCGCPLGPAIGLVDAMRIGPDVAPQWAPAFLGHKAFFKPEINMPSARNTIQNALTRAPLHGRWWVNDPDCLLLRPDTELTLAEVQSLATVIALTGGQLLLSDNLPALPAERLHIAQASLPLLGKAARAIDWFDRPNPQRFCLDLEGPAGNWHVLAQFNWSDAAETIAFCLADFQLPPGAYHGREFWTGQLVHPQKNATPLSVSLPAHGVALFAFRPAAAIYLGSNIHLSQGQEISTWTEGDRRLEFRLHRPLQALSPDERSRIWLQLPKPLQQVSINGQPTAWKSLPDESISIEFTPELETTFELGYNND